MGRDESWSELKEVFLGAIDHSDEERQAFLQAACQAKPLLRERVDEMLMAHESADQFLDTGSDRFRRLLQVAFDGDVVSEGDRVGSYRVIRRIATGGMGVVYEAEQDNPRRRVALKLMRLQAATPSLRRRFEREARLMGRLEHPGIARIYEAGIIGASHAGDPTDTVPFFAMELVHGEPLLDYAETKGLRLRERLELFLEVCAAAHHAHSKGVIHRDLKPGNILVESCGQPKILDFGVARASDGNLLPTTLHTEAGQLLGTLPYMSPEQISGDPLQVDERSDVYALGVLLYELITGRLPHDLKAKTIPAAARIIQEMSAPPLKSAERTFRGDLETIVATALAKEKEQRYASAARLAADLQRYLREEPIRARPPSAVYALRKFVRRHRAVATALAALLLTVVLASLVSFGFAFRAARERDGAVDAREQAEQAIRESDSANRFLMDLLTQTPIGTALNTQTVIMMASSLLEEEPMHPAAEIAMRSMIGRSLLDLGRKPDAEHHLLRRLELARELHGERDDHFIRALQDLAMLYAHWGKLDACRDALRHALRIRRGFRGSHDLGGYNSSRLGWQILQYVPQSPEARAIWSGLPRNRGRLAPVRSPVAWGTRCEGPQILVDDFGGEGLDPAWVPSLLDATDWSGGVRASRLEVEDITRTGVGSGTITFERPLDPLGDFHVACKIVWSSEAASGGTGEQAMQSLLVGLVTDLPHIEYMGYRDSWFATAGEKVAWAEERTFSTGSGSLPLSGSAELEIHRVGERVTFFWDGLPLATSISTAPLLGVQLIFGRCGRNSHLGRLAVESLVVEGLAAEPAAAPPGSRDARR